MLKAIAQALQSKFGSDKTYRIGGDEFVVFTFGESEKQIEDDIESIKNDIEKQGYSYLTAYRSARFQPMLKDL